ncbi:hypothetical protein BJV82DRAFT_8024 [Fennellomyces sp. T-0311]|nr:hypothetical protein BJV82DRAFT_8024 [Fennellomyces sp. T-0311]
MPLQRQRRASYTAIKRESRSPMSIGHDSEAEMDNEEYVSADSSSQIDSSDDQDNDNTMPSNLQDLMLQLRHQQTKQARYVEKTRRLSERMQQTSLRIAQLTGMALEGPTPRSSPSTPRTARKRRDPSPLTNKTSPTAELDEDQPLRRANYAKRTGGPPQSAPAAKVPRRNNDAPVALARRTGPLANRRTTVQATSPKPSPSHRRPEVEQIKLASRDVCDLFLNRNQDAKTIAFYKKPRSLLFNIAENDASMKDLLITTSLKGDMQCWYVDWV